MVSFSELVEGVHRVTHELGFREAELYIAEIPDHLVDDEARSALWLYAWLIEGKKPAYVF